MGTYRVLDPPRKLVYTWLWETDLEAAETLVTVEFHDRGGSTEIVLTREGTVPGGLGTRVSDHAEGAEGVSAGRARLQAARALALGERAGFEKSHKEMVAKVKKTPEADLNKTVKFFVGPKQMGDVRRMDVLWMMVMDSVHHRGQFSVYLRMSGGKVPSIYRPSADEPWM